MERSSEPRFDKPSSFAEEAQCSLPVSSTSHTHALCLSYSFIRDLFLPISLCGTPESEIMSRNGSAVPEVGVKVTLSNDVSTKSGKNVCDSFPPFV